jgi:hypothetical protein
VAVLSGRLCSRGGAPSLVARWRRHGRLAPGWYSGWWRHPLLAQNWAFWVQSRSRWAKLGPKSAITSGQRSGSSRGWPGRQRAYCHATTIASWGRGASLLLMLRLVGYHHWWWRLFPPALPLFNRSLFLSLLDLVGLVTLPTLR